MALRASRQLRELRARIADLEAAAGPPNATMPQASSPRFATGGGPSWGWTGSVYVGRDEAMNVPTLSYIRAQLAGGVSSMPLERFRQPAGGLGDPVQIEPGWCQDPDPANQVTPSVFWAWIIDDLFFQGRSTLIVLARDATGYPTAFRRVMPGQLTYDPQTLAWGTYWPTVVYYMGREIPQTDVIVIDGPHDGICNYGGPVIRAALDLEAAAGQAAVTPMPNIELHQSSGEPLSQTAADELVSSWQAARALGATAYTPSNLDARAITGWSSADLQMIEARQYMATQLARLAGVNPVLVSAAMGSSSSYVYTNQADYRRAFLDDVLDTYLRAIEGRLSANDVCPRGQYLQFDRDSFTTLSMLERVQIFVGALRAGALPEMVSALADALDLDFDMPSPTGVEPPPPPPPPTSELIVPPQPATTTP
jgi:phage portal protein BeeE